MRRSWKVLAGVLVGGVALARMPAADTAQLNRDLLWATVRLCVLNVQTLGSPAPCVSVAGAGAGQPGVALLHVPGAVTHFVVTPTDAVAGLESIRLQGPDGAAFVQAALSARADVVRATGGRAALTDVGIAVNSRMARSQDQLHLHVDCVAAQTRALLVDARLGPSWTPLPDAGKTRRRYLARVYGEGERFNPFAELAHLIGDPALMRQASLAITPIPAGFALIADLGPRGLAERLLDHSCAAASGALVQPEG